MPNNEKIVHVSTREASTFDDAKRIAAQHGGHLPNADDYAKEALAAYNCEESKYKYEIGESVIFINDNGVNWGQRTVIGRKITCYGPAYYIQPTDTPWFAIPERNLYKANELKNKESQV